MKTKEESPENQELLSCIKDVVGRRPTYGYRRVTAMVRKILGKPVNFKRVYRLMKKEKLLLQKYGSKPCLLYTSPSPRDRQKSRMPSSA